MKLGGQKLITAALSCGLVTALVACKSTPPPQTPTQSASVPTPTLTADKISGPASGNTMTKEYVQMVGRAAYLWGWPLVNNAHRHAAFSEAPAPGLMGGVLPVAHNALSMLTNYVSPEQRFVTCTNQDVVYGFGFLDTLDTEPIVFQVPDFGDRFWVYALYDARAPTSFPTSVSNTGPNPVST